MSVRRWLRGVATTVSATSLLLICLAPAAYAADTAIHQDQMNELCRVQYPAAGIYGDGFAYVVAPGDAFSWRCQQPSPSGALSNLGIDPAAFCRMPPGYGAPTLINPGSSGGWVCRT